MLTESLAVHLLTESPVLVLCSEGCSPLRELLAIKEPSCRSSCSNLWLSFMSSAMLLALLVALDASVLRLLALDRAWLLAAFKLVDVT